MFRRILLIALVLLLSGGGYYFWQEHNRLKQDNGSSLTLYGNVEIRRVHLGFRVSGRIASILYEEGMFVEKGALIAQLDREPYENARDAIAAQAESAKQNYTKMQLGNRPQEISQARAAFNEQNASLCVLENDLKRYEQLDKNHAISPQEFETVRARRDEAAAKKNYAEEHLNLLIEGFRQEDIAVAKAQYSEAAANLKRAETALNDTELLCPNDGILLTRVEEVGAVVNAGQIILTLSLQNAVWVYVYVPETQLGKLAPGMKAEIFTDSQPNEPHCGHIGYISPEAEFTPKTVETTELRTSLVYRVRMIVDNPNNGLRQGMPVTVKIALDKYPPKK